jgi:DNA (cytosine-5)-methyltransferase 1
MKNSLELFAGAGGLCIGLHHAGFNAKTVVEWDSHCCDTIRLNQDSGHPLVSPWPLLQGDVRDVDFTAYRDRIDLVSGGPPCQPFSLGGQHNGQSDRRDMFGQAVRAVRQIRPRAFIFENVKGLTRQRFSAYFAYIQRQLAHPEIQCRDEETWISHLARLEDHHRSRGHSGLSYRVTAQVLNAADFGVPQKRERVFLVGFRDDLNVDFGFPLATHSREALLWDKAHGGYFERHQIERDGRQSSSRRTIGAEKPTTLPWRTVRDALAGLPDPETQPDAAAAWSGHAFKPGAKSYPGHTGSAVDEPAKTLKAGVHGVPGGENMLRQPDGSVRHFTVRECARLQSFPDNFHFHGSWSKCVHQLGNAVPVELARHVGIAVMTALEDQ